MTTQGPDLPWDASWWTSARTREMRAWRAVEAQHVVATMRLVDPLQEQAVLEQLLEANKPALPSAARAQHYLLATPFRYRPSHGSRFRQPGTRGIWYGAALVRTACAEVAYWRWRFLVDSAGLQQAELLTEHTVFAAQVAGLAIDLMESPWEADRARWTDPVHYRATQQLADAAIDQGVQWLRYESVRDPGGVCCAVMAPQALMEVDLGSQQTWHCRTTRQAVRMVRAEERYEWSMGG